MLVQWAHFRPLLQSPMLVPSRENFPLGTIKKIRVNDFMVCAHACMHALVAMHALHHAASQQSHSTLHLLHARMHADVCWDRGD